MLILNVFVLAAVFFLLGYGCLHWALSPLQTKIKSSTYFVAPGFGAFIFAGFSHGVQFFTNQPPWLASALVASVLIFLSLKTLILDLKGGHFGFLTLGMGALIVLGYAVVVTLPFVSHLAPPDVDAMAFGYFAFLMKSGLGFPIGQPWLDQYAQVSILASDANSLLAVMVSRLANLDLAISLLSVTCFWLVATCLIGFSIAQSLLEKFEIEEGSKKFVALIVAGFVFNRAAIWEYGDGSYARVAATCGFLLIAVLIGMYSRHSGERRRAITIGIMHGGLAYFHYRFFIWHTVILGVWLLKETFVEPKARDRWTALVLIPATSAIVISPLAWSVLRHGNGFAKRLVSPLFAAKHSLSGPQLLEQFLRFQGWVLPIIVVVGVVIVLAARSSIGRSTQMLSDSTSSNNLDKMHSFALIHLFVMAFFCWDSLVLAVAPWTFNLLYSQMAVISNFTFSKLVFGTATISSFGFVVQSIQRSKIKVSILVLVQMVGIAANCHLLTVHIAAQVPQFSFLFGVYGTETWYAIVLIGSSLVAVGILIWRMHRNLVSPMGSEIKIVSNAIIVALLVTMSYELIGARFNYPYVSPGDVEVFQWLRENTDPKKTLVLNYSALDLDENVEESNFALLRIKGARAGSLDFRTHWLPVISERAAIFHRGNLVSRFAGGSFLVLKGSLPNLADFDRAYFAILSNQTVLWTNACQLLRSAGVTHLYVPASIRNHDQNPVRPCLKIVFSALDRRDILQTRVDENAIGPAIYELTKQAPDKH